MQWWSVLLLSYSHSGKIAGQYYATANLLFFFAENFAMHVFNTVRKRKAL